MNFIDNWKISTKILAVIALLSCVTIVVMTLAVVELRSVTENLYEDRRG